MKKDNNIRTYIMQKIFPAFMEAWMLRMKIKGKVAQDKSYREGYWDGVADTLKIGLSNNQEKPTLH